VSVGILISFHYFRTDPLEERLAAFDRKPLVFADSGAFSAANIGSEITIADYSAWLTEHAGVIDMAATLDVIGDPKATAKNTTALEKRGHEVVPVFHVGSPWPELKRIVKTHKLVALGGMVPHARSAGPQLRRWLTYAVGIADDAGARCHAFGITVPTIISRLPLFSCDSTTWKSSARYGDLFLWDDVRGWVTLPRDKKERRIDEMRLMRSYGLDPGPSVKKSYGIGNRDEMDAAWMAVAVAHVRFARWFHDRFAPVEVAGLPPGPHTFLSCVPNHIPRFVVPLFNKECAA